MQKIQPFHMATFGVLVVAAIMLAATLLISPTSAADTNANVNIDNVAPSISVTARTSSVDGAWSPSGSLTPTPGGDNTITVNADVTDLNGFANQTITVTAVADRTTSSISDYNCTGHEHNCVPRTGPVTCSNLDSGDPTRKFQCIVPIHYNSDPTAAGTQAAPGESYTGEEWHFIVRANDTVVNVDDKTSNFEYNELVAMNVINGLNKALGTTATDGTETPDDALFGSEIRIQNFGNTQQDWTTQVNKATDSLAWTCTGTGNPLISDLRQHTLGSTDYAFMTPLTNSGSTYTFDENFNREPDNASTTQSFYIRFATTETITPGTCTLSAMVVTALKST